MNEVTEPGTFELPLRYVLPSNLQLIEKSDENITLTIVRKSEEKAENAEGGAD